MDKKPGRRSAGKQGVESGKGGLAWVEERTQTAVLERGILSRPNPETKVQWL